MELIRDKNGEVIQRSRNLAGIRRYVSKNIIKILSIDEIDPPHGEGKLCILFENGASFECNFASFAVLKEWIRNWRNSYGSPLLVNGENAGIVESKNSKLI